MTTAPASAPTSPPTVLFGESGDSGRRAQANLFRPVPPVQAATSAAAAAKAMRKASCHKTTRWASDQGIQIEAKPVSVALRTPSAVSPATTAGRAHTRTMTGASAIIFGRCQAVSG